LRRALAAEGFASVAVPARGKSAMEQFFHCVFVSQLWCLAEARRAGMAAPRFLSEARRLRVSDRMIY
ncbi:MAG: hypothetical protein KGI26_03565, partial [Thaumarchaeota archaeon]|nr:hypothetical protein [Nitrososphaerota archaeon]